MLPAEIPFPRGGKRKRKSKDEQDANENLISMLNDGGQKKTRKKKKKMQKPDELSTEQKPNVAVENLTKQNISPGMVLLGCVFEVQDYCIKLSLPGRLFGTVPINKVSDKYTELIEAFAGNPDNDEVSTLQALFRIGQTLPCKVMESADNLILLSVNPSHVNEDLQPASLLDGMHLYCAVHSVEDHGYVMDIGIKDVPGFLSQSSALQYIKDCNGGQNLTVGHLVPTVINMPSLKKGKLRFGQAVTLSVGLAKLSDLSNIALDTFTPGTTVEAVVEKITDHGLVVDCLGFSGCVYKDHIKNVAGIQEGQSFQGTVLYNNPVTHVLHLTMHPMPNRKKFNKMFGGLKKWQVIENAVVTAIHKSHMCLKVKDNVQGIAIKKELSDQRIENLKERFSVGDTVQCRVISLHYLDNMISVSLKESILSQTYVRHDELTVGEVYDGKVKKLVPGGMVVILSPGVQGFVRDIYMANVPLTKPELMFPEGKAVKCKVLRIDHSSSPPSILLTCKKGMITTKVPILSSYKEASQGVITKGVIVNIRDNGLVVSFLNNIQGWVPSSEFGAYKIQHPEKVFFKGQVVKCRVINCYPEDQKLFLTLKIDSTKVFGDKDMSQSKFEVGKIVEVRVKKKTEKGLDVVLKGTKFQAFLPLLHLSDHIENCQSLLECYREKDVITALCFGSKGVPIVTMKSSLIEAAGNGLPRSLISEYQEQVVIPVVVKHFAKYGMFVELGHNITGLVPNKYIADRNVVQPEEAGFVPYQTLMGKIRNVDHERNRLELSTKLEDIYKGNYTYGLDLLQSYFDDISRIAQYYMSTDDVKSKLSELSTGSLVSVKVTYVTESGILCMLPDGIKGFATTYHCGTIKIEEGQDLRAVVLFVDMTNECVELSCLPSLVRNVSNLRDIDSSKVKIDQVIKSECVVIKKEFVVVALGGHAVGRFAFLPTRRALNDLIGRADLFTVGQPYHVVIKRIISGDIAFGVLKQHVRDLKDNNEATMLRRKNKEMDLQAKKQISAECSGSSDLHQDQVDDGSVASNKYSELEDASQLVVGKKYVATIKKIKQFQMNILINGIPGRVHITKATEDITEGIKPFKNFVPESEIEVWLIGFHFKQLHNFLALSHCKVKAYAECSLFKCPPCALNHTFKSGDEVKGFIKEVSDTDITVWLTPDIKGILPFHHLNVDRSVLLKPRKYYRKGEVVEAHVVDVLGEKVLLTQYPGWEPEPGMNIIGLVHFGKASKGLFVNLPHGYSGEVHLTDLRDAYIPADGMLSPLLRKRIVQCHILDVDHTTKFCQLSTRVSRLGTSHNEPKDPELSEEDIEVGITVRGFITHVTDSAVTVTLGRNLDGAVDISSIDADERNHILRSYFIGSVVDVKVLSNRNGGMALSILRKTQDGQSLASVKNKRTQVKKDVPEDFQPATQQSLAGVKNKRTRVKKDASEDFQPATQQSESPTKSLPCLQVADGFNFGVRSISDLKRPAEDLSDASDCDGEKPPKRHRKDSDRLDDEEFVFETENLLMDENRTAQTAEDYEELLKQSPSSAGHWLNYIGFHLEKMEVDKARDVAERALKIIPFREEQEKLKIWIVFLNLENMYGTQETLQNVFERAVQKNEPLKIYSVVAQIYSNSNKNEEAEKLYQIMVKKFHSKDVWVDFGLFYMKTGRPELARKVMDRGLQSLDKKQHVDVIAKFAQMEFKHGDVNLGKTMFENILKNYRKRTDLWSVYIDLLIKHGELESARHLFKEVIAMKMSSRKMKFFFKRYLTFERDHGTEEMAEEVVKKASEYFKSDFLSL